TCFLETWKRYNAALQFDWDVLEFEKEELPRPEFVGTMVRKSPITFKQEIHFPFGKRLRKLFVSGMIVFVSICIVTVTIGVLLIYPQRLFAYGNAWGSVVVGLINLATVITLNMVYSQSAIWLTDFENHRTATSYEDSLTLKIYLFDFVNFYSALFYIMLFKQKFFHSDTDKDGCQFQSCLTELTIQLAIILIGKQAVGQFQELLLPWILRKFRKGAILAEMKAFEDKHKRSKRKDSEIPQWTQDDRLVSIHSEVRSEYEEMVVQFGFISLFATAFPLAPLFAFLNNLTEIRSDAYKYLVTNQRAVGHQAQDIGMWENILRVISLLAVLTNAGIIAFHSTYMRKQFDKYIDNNDQLLVARLLFMLIFEHAVFLLKLGFALLIPDVPKAVRIAIERENYMARIALEDEDPAADELEEAEEDDKKIYSLVGSLNLQKLKRVMHHNHVYFHEKSQ
ncbi:10952_t:CDS:10, partial [Paraglomus occultum]